MGQATRTVQRITASTVTSKCSCRYDVLSWRGKPAINWRPWLIDVACIGHSTTPHGSFRRQLTDSCMVDGIPPSAQHWRFQKSFHVRSMQPEITISLLAASVSSPLATSMRCQRQHHWCPYRQLWVILTSLIGKMKHVHQRRCFGRENWNPKTHARTFRALQEYASQPHPEGRRYEYSSIAYPW